MERANLLCPSRPWASFACVHRWQILHILSLAKLFLQGDIAAWPQHETQHAGRMHSLHMLSASGFAQCDGRKLLED